jgi:hypothetical protein
MPNNVDAWNEVYQARFSIIERHQAGQPLPIKEAPQQATIAYRFC